MASECDGYRRLWWLRGTKLYEARRSGRAEQRICGRAGEGRHPARVAATVDETANLLEECGNGSHCLCLSRRIEGLCRRTFDRELARAATSHELVERIEMIGAGHAQQLAEVRLGQEAISHQRRDLRRHEIA